LEDFLHGKSVPIAETIEKLEQQKHGLNERIRARKAREDATCTPRRMQKSPNNIVEMRIFID
jgi:hypothetical protein